MKASAEVMSAFYQHLGELFYAIAKVDGVVREQEEETLNRLVRDTWTGLEDSEDEFGTDAAYRIIAVFDQLNDGFTTSEEWFEDFRAFRKLHEQLFTPEVCQAIMRTADAIASSFARKNAPERNMLTRLNFALHGAVL